MVPVIVPAQTNGPQPTDSLSAPSTPLEEMSLTLVQRLETRNLQVIDLNNSLRLALESEASLRKDLTATSLLLGESETKLKDSLRESNNYRILTESQIKEIQAERDRWEWATYIAGGAAGGALIGGALGDGMDALTGAAIGAGSGFLVKLVRSIIPH
jgi:hypothetical protein